MRRAFTLIQMLVVISIIAVFTALLLLTLLVIADGHVKSRKPIVEPFTSISDLWATQ